MCVLENSLWVVFSNRMTAHVSVETAINYDIIRFL